MEYASSGTGRVGEQIAKEYLLSKGMVCVEENFRCKGGEIDLIMLDGVQFVFVEVKTRRYGSDASAFEAVPRRKGASFQERRFCICARKVKAARPAGSTWWSFLGEPPDSGVKHYKNAFPFSAKGYFV
jgi:putative endonuclease